MPKRKHRYLEAVLGKKEMKTFRESLEAVRSPKMRPVANAFSANMQRLSALAVTPAEVAYSIRRDAGCWFYAEYKITGKVEPPTADREKLPREVGEEHVRQLASFNTLTSDQKSEAVANWGVGYIELLLEQLPAMSHSVDALFSSLIIGAWSAFEALASDLWVMAVDTGPKILRNRVMSKCTRPERSDHPEDMVSPDEIEFDPQKKYGSALRASRKVSFQKLRLIAANYEIAFGKDVKPIFKNDDLIVLSAYRNALVHASERADHTFKQRVASIPPFNKIKRNSRLVLNGGLVSRLKAASMKVGLNLVQFVDDFLSNPHHGKR